MDYEYFHEKSIGWVGLAHYYKDKECFDDALWCCKQALELEHWKMQGLITVSTITRNKSNFYIQLIKSIVNGIEKDKRLGGNYGS